MLTIALFLTTFVVTVVQAFRHGIVYIFVLYQAYYFFNPPTKWWSAYIPDIRYSFYIVLTLLLVTFIRWNRLRDNRLLAIPQFTFLCFNAFLYSIASYYAVLPDIHYMALDAVITITLLVIIVYKLISTEEQLNVALKGYICFAGYMAYYVSQFGRTTNGRFEGAGMVDSPDANGIAAALGPAVVISLYYLWTSEKWVVKLFFALVCVYLANALVQLGSRGAFLGVFLSCTVFLFLMFFSKMQLKKQRLQVVLLLCCGLLGTAIVTDSTFWQRMSTIKTTNLETATEFESGSTRVFFWKAAIEMAKDHPFGAGASGFIYHAQFYIPIDIDTGKSRNRAVHSTWFEVLSEIGYLGLLSFLCMIYYTLITVARTLKELKNQNKIKEYFLVAAIGCSFLCFIVSMTFLNRFRAEILYWCILFCSIAYNIYVLKPRLNQGAD